jgi:hypothetical protein
MTASRRSRVFSISMPPEMAEKAMAMAQAQNRTMSELMRECFRAYQAQSVGTFFEAMGTYASTRNPRAYTVEDIPRLINEVRAETRMEGEQAKRKLA